jgi:hypothetical protein
MGNGPPFKKGSKMKPGTYDRAKYGLTGKKRKNVKKTKKAKRKSR